MVEQISLTIFKLKYNLPDRALEDLFDIDHVTISRIIHRITYYLSQFNTSNLSTMKNNFYIIDSTTLRIGKGKNNATYSGYKHHHGVKFQLIINDLNQIMCVSKSYDSSHHDKKIFLMEYENLMKKLDKNLNILGDKAYAGLHEYQVNIPTKINEKEYKRNKLLAKTNNKTLSSKRIKIEHVFAYMKTFRILQRLNHYSIAKINIFFQSIANIYNFYKI